MNNAERFLNAFSQIEHELHRILDLKEHWRFFDLIRKAAKLNPVIERFKYDLKEYGELRNAIVHDRTGGEVIAQPNNEVVENLERIVSLLLEPPKVLPLFQKEVLTLSISDALSNAIKQMSHFSYSQVAIRENDAVVTMLTSNMLIRWLGETLHDENFDLNAISVGDVLSEVGREDNFRLVAAHATLFEVLDLFSQHQNEGKKLESVLITEHSHPHEPFLGIITNRDLPKLQQELKS